jgi:hypothetical protein
MSSLKQASWAHGVGVQLGNSSWKAHRQGFGTTVTPTNETTTTGWVHIAIPTPVWLHGVQLKASTALVQVATGSAARITMVHVYDGEKKILDISSDITGPTQIPRFQVPGTPAIHVATEISMLVNFENTGPNAWCRLIGGGIDFV